MVWLCVKAFSFAVVCETGIARVGAASSSVIVIVGGVVSKFIYFDAVLFVEVAVFFVEVSEACIAEFPAKSLTSAVMVSVPSLSVERSRPLAE